MPGRPRDPRQGYRWLISALVRLLPEELKAEYGDSIVEDYTLKYGETRAAEGRLAAHRFALLSVSDLLSTSLRERVRRRPSGVVKSERRLVTGDVSWLDLKLAFRMLVKHPVLTLAAVLASSVAIGVGVLYFDIANGFVNPTLPFEDGERVVTIQNEDLDTRSTEGRSLHDFVMWRDELDSVEDLGVFARHRGNLATEDGYVEAVGIVEISAAAFRVARIPPLLGRPLTEADERHDAPVVVVGERLWEAAFGRDPGIVGRSVELAGSTRTVVGVMPKGVALPVNEEIWVPFRADALEYERGGGPWIGTIGRLAAGVTLEEAQAELTVLGDRIAAEFPETNARLRPRIVPYLEPHTGGRGLRWSLMGLNTAFMLLVLVICANIGALVFARIATRESELAVRSALGASRSRIVMQFFVEALVLTSAGAVIALVAASWALRRGTDLLLALEDGAAAPFWWRTDLDPTTFLYVGVLAVLGAVIIGGLPALKATKGGIQVGLQRRATGGFTMRSRRMSTAVIVAQVALSGALVPVAIWGIRLVAQYKAVDCAFYGAGCLGIPTDEYLIAEYGTATSPDLSERESSTRLDAAYATLKERLLADPGVVSVTFADKLPGMTNPDTRIEVADDEGGTGSAIHRVRIGSVGVDYFDAFSVPILFGRGFQSGDVGSDVGVVIVNQSFVERVLGGRNAIGRRVRYVGPEQEEPGRWHEIVGVVPDLEMNPFDPDHAQGLYRPTAPAEIRYPFLAVRVGGNPGAYARKLRSIAAAADPALLVHGVHTWDELRSMVIRLYRWVSTFVVLGVSFIVFLSAVVTFALMSLTVSRRTREIGVRRALGADRGSIVASVFTRAFVQLGLGAGLGAMVSILGLSALESAVLDRTPSAGLILAIFALMLLLGVLSCGPPVARALRIQPTEAMRADV